MGIKNSYSTANTTLEQLEKDRQVNNFLSNIYGYKYYISGISVYGVNGKTYSQGLTQSLEMFENQAWYADIEKRAGKSFFTPPHATSPYRPEDYVFSIGRAIKHGNQHVGTVMINMQYDLTFLLELI